MLSDRLTLAQKKRFGASSEKYAGGYEQLNLFNEAEQAADQKEEELSAFETTEVIEHKLSGEEKYCPECGTKYRVVAKETVKHLKFIPAHFEVVEENTYVYSCPNVGR